MILLLGFRLYPSIVSLLLNEGMDPHPMCIACMGSKHAQALLADSQSCSHFFMPEKILERRLNVAVSNSQDPWLAAITPKPYIHQVWASMSSAAMIYTKSPVLPLLFHGLDHGVDEDTDCNVNSDLLDMVDMEEEDNDSTFPPKQSWPSSADDVAPPADSNFYKVCKRAAWKSYGQQPMGLSDWTGTCMTVKGSRKESCPFMKSLLAQSF